MRILRILNSQDKGGILTYEIQFIRELQKRDIIVDAIIVGEAEQAKGYKQLCNKSFTLPFLDASYTGPLTNIAASIYKSYRYGKKHARHVQRQLNGNEPYDAILYSRPNYIHLAGLLSRLTGVKCIWHLPNTVNSELSKRYYNAFCRRYGIVQVANSFYTKGTLGGQCQHVVYPGYDDERVKQSEASYRELLNIPKNVPVYGVAARIYKDKAQDIVVKAFIESEIPGNNGHLLVAGGPLDSDFSRHVQQLAKGLEGKQVHFLGNIDNLPMFYASVDVVINGRRNAEPFGISVAEAFGAGKPVLAYYLGGPSEMITHRQNGWLVEEPTVESFKNAMNETLEDREGWASMGSHAKSCANQYSVKSNVAKLLTIISG